MGKASVVLVLGAMFLFALSNRNRNENMLTATDTVSVDYSEKRARSIANGTVQMVLSKLSDSTKLRVSTPRTATMLGGKAVYTIKDTTIAGETLIRIASTGSYAGKARSVTALARHDVPPFFKYASLSEGEFKINATNDTIRDAFNPQWNANVHSNTTVVLDLSNTLIKGFVTYTGSITWDPSKVVISPNQNPDGLPVVASAPKINIPTFNPATYLPIATETYMGDRTYANGTFALSTDRLNPSIIYVGGKLYLEKATFTGYGVFVTTGDVEVKGNTLVSPVDPLGSKLGIYTAGKIMINNDNTTVHAQMFANNEIEINGKNAKIHGNIIGKMNVRFNSEGNALYYKPALETLTSPFWLSLTKRLVARHHFE